MSTVEGLLSERYRPEDLDDIFSFLSAEERCDLFAYLELRELQHDEIVIKNGDHAGFVAFLVDGKLAVKMESIFPGKFILVAVLERGSLVGEGAFAGEGKRHATVVASEPSKLLILTENKMELLLKESPVLGMKLFRWTIRVLGQRLAKASDRLSRLL